MRGKIYTPAPQSWQKENVRDVWASGGWAPSAGSFIHGTTGGDVTFDIDNTLVL